MTSQRAERLSVPVTLLVLLIAFGALVAAIVPVLLAVTAVIAAFGLLGPISQVFPLDLEREDGRAADRDGGRRRLRAVLRDPLPRGANTRTRLARRARAHRPHLGAHGRRSRAATVAIAMAGQFVIGTDIFNGIASGTIAVIACAVVGSVTVLPAVLALLGPRIDRGVIPFLPHLRRAATTRASGRRWSSGYSRPVPSLPRAHGGRADRARAARRLGMHLAFRERVRAARASQARLQAQIDAKFPQRVLPRGGRAHRLAGARTPR